MSREMEGPIGQQCAQMRMRRRPGDSGKDILNKPSTVPPQLSVTEARSASHHQRCCPCRCRGCRFGGMQGMQMQGLSHASDARKAHARNTRAGNADDGNVDASYGHAADGHAGNARCSMSLDLGTFRYAWIEGFIRYLKNRM
ncbi:hypothetical protein MRX96_039795 [Rhipicephalus microplus]